MPPPDAALHAIPNLWKRLDRKAQLIANAISVPAGLDAGLATVCYTSLLLHNISPLPQRSVNLQTLYGILEDTRIFIRLFGLLDIYATARETYTKQHRDPVIKVLLWASLASGTAFQVIENIALLVQTAVLRGSWLRSKENTFWIFSNRFWLGQLLFDLARLLRVRQLRFKKDFGAEEAVAENEDPAGETSVGSAGKQEAIGVARVEDESLLERWRRDLYFTAASIPLAVHWSFEESRSPINGIVFAASGLVAGVIGLQEATREWE